MWMLAIQILTVLCTCGRNNSNVYGIQMVGIQIPSVVPCHLILFFDTLQVARISTWLTTLRTILWSRLPDPRETRVADPSSPKITTLPSRTAPTASYSRTRVAPAATNPALKKKSQNRKKVPRKVLKNRLNLHQVPRRVPRKLNQPDDTVRESKKLQLRVLKYKLKVPNSRQKVHNYQLKAPISWLKALNYQLKVPNDRLKVLSSRRKVPNNLHKVLKNHNRPEAVNQYLLPRPQLREGRAKVERRQKKNQTLSLRQNQTLAWVWRHRRDQPEEEDPWCLLPPRNWPWPETGGQLRCMRVEWHHQQLQLENESQWRHKKWRKEVELNASSNLQLMRLESPQLAVKKAPTSHKLLKKLQILR